MDNLTRVKKYIHDQDRLGVFAFDLYVIGQTEYTVKDGGSLWPDSATTWGARSVALMRGFWGLSLLDQSAVMIHETIHARQIEKLGKFWFYFKYLAEHFKQGYEKNPFEVEARSRETQWRKMIASLAAARQQQ